MLRNAYTRPELSYNPTISIGRREVEAVLTELRSYDEELMGHKLSLSAGIAPLTNDTKRITFRFAAV